MLVCGSFLTSSLLVTVGCEKDTDCSYNEKCFNGVCHDPCQAGRPCAPTATCTTVSHKVQCSCGPGLTGNPTTSCLRVGCSSSEECPLEQACYQEECVDPCLLTSPCGPGSSCHTHHHTTTCTCPPHLVGDPYEKCSQPETPECLVDMDCAPGLGCVDKECTDLCLYLKPCGVKALCRTVDLPQMRTVMCECPPGHAGNAYKQCNPTIEEQPKCQSDVDCPIFHACIDNECRNPCEDNPCSANAECHTMNHRPTCFCPLGFTGDGYEACNPNKCNSDNECASDSVCFNYRCVEACTVMRPCGANAKCHSVQHKAECQCESGYTGNAYDLCVVIGCTDDSACPSTQSCQNNVCIDECLRDNPCVASQSCTVVNHRVKCTCLSGYIPFQDGCIKDEPQPRPICETDQDCTKGEACLDGTCQDLCEKNPCGKDATCTTKSGSKLTTIICQCGPGLMGNPFRECTAVPTVPSGCSTHQDCPWNRGCAQGTCRDPCLDNQCGVGATCHAVGHRSVCSCASGYQGDPNVACFTGGWT